MAEKPEFVSLGFDATTTSRLCHCLSAVENVRASKRFSLYAGLTLAVLLDAAVGPLLAQVIAGPGLPGLTPSRYWISFLLFIISSLLVLSFLGDRLTLSVSQRRLMLRWFVLVPFAMLLLFLVGVLIYNTYQPGAIKGTDEAWAYAIVCAFVGFPITLLIISLGVVAAQANVELSALATCWDVLTVDLFELILALKAPKDYYDLEDLRGWLGETDRSLDAAFPDRVLLKVLPLHLERLEEAAYRTTVNFTGALRYRFFGTDPSTRSWLTRRGLEIAEDLRSIKRNLIEPGTASQALADVTAKFVNAAQRQWDKLGHPLDQAAQRRAWRAVLLRALTIVVIAGAAAVAPYVITGEAGKQVRAGLIVVAIAAVFTPGPKTGERAFDVLKSSYMS